MSFFKGLKIAAVAGPACLVGAYPAFSPAVAAETGSIPLPERPRSFTEVGIASFYSQTGRTASGVKADPNSLSAAHPRLPFGSRVVVTHLRSGKQVTVTINDRGPFRKGRIIDLSHHAAKELGIVKYGVARVRVTSVD